MTCKHYLLILIATLSFVLMPVAANAQYVELSCNNDGTVVDGTQLYYADQANQKGACQFQGVQHVFSQIACDFIVVVNKVLGQAYCGIQYSITPILAIVMTLYLIVFGMQILMGTAQLNSADIVSRLIKIAVVWALVTNASWGITYIFQFFIGAAQSGSLWVLEFLGTDSSNITGNAFCSPLSGTVQDSNIMTTYQYLDMIICNAITGPFTNANDEVIGFFIVMMFFFPTIFSMAVTWMVMTLMMLARTLIGFLLCISILAFLIALSPIFLSFMLFRSTMHFFEDWLKFMISYTLQIVIIFAIIALWIKVMQMFGGFFTNLANLIVPYQNLLATTVFNPDSTYGICNLSTLTFSPPGQPGMGCQAGQPCMPALQCNPAPPPDSPAILAPSMLLNNGDFIYFMTYNLAALIIIAYAFSVLIKNAPSIASQISGPATVPPMGGGWGMGGVGQAGGGVGGVGKGGVAAAPVGDRQAVKEFLGNAHRLLTGRK